MENEEQNITESLSDKLTRGLEMSFKKLAKHKRDHNLTMVIYQNDKIVKLTGKDIKFDA